ncbi:MAG: hypothetical protein CL748_05270 [Chloroflexi bacterium]|nr:hypothetical protein [Chloroflexota bacterium]
MIGKGIPKGFIITLKNFLRTPVTVQYPDRKVSLIEYAKIKKVNIFKLIFSQPMLSIKVSLGIVTIPTNVEQSQRFRGNEFTFFEERCTVCASCAKYCPLGIIEIVSVPGGFDAQEGESYKLEVFDIDIGRCMFCGLCVEACPYDALHMGTKFEKSTYVRDNLIITKEQLAESEKSPSSFYRPQFEKQNFDPYKENIDDHYEAGRHEKPENKELKKKWVDDR